MAPLFALVTCFTYATDTYLVRQGLARSPQPMVATVVTLTVNFAFFVILFLLFVPAHFLRFDWIYPFIIAGILAPGAARAFSYKGIEKLGLSINTPIVNAESLFAVLMAILFLNEPVTLPMVAGISSVVTGLALLGYETGRNKGSHTAKRIEYRYLVFPVMASIFYGMSVFFRKLGLNAVGSPILGATFTSGTSWCIFMIAMMKSRNRKALFEVKKESLVYFLLGGVTTCIGWFALFSALNIGKVSIVTPIATSYSLVTLLISYFLLRKVELITARIVAATILVVGGVVVLSVLK
jgi:drug/metabolite transporter, DME family